MDSNNTIVIKNLRSNRVIPYSAKMWSENEAALKQSNWIKLEGKDAELALINAGFVEVTPQEAPKADPKPKAAKTPKESKNDNKEQ